METATTEVIPEVPVVAETVKAPEPAKLAIDPVEYAKLWQELEQGRAFKANAEAANKAALDAAASVALATLAETKGAKAALEEQHRLLTADLEAEKRERLALQAVTLNDKRSAAITDALGATAFASDAARRDAIEKVSSILEARQEGAEIVVRSKADGRSAKDAVASLLASPDFAHYLAPKSRGGSGSQGSEKPAPLESESTVDPFIAFERKRMGIVGNGPRPNGLR